MYGLAQHGKLIDQVQRLDAHLRVLAIGNRIRLSHCDICDSFGDSTLPCCPFCGDEAPVDGRVVDLQEIEVVPVKTASVSRLDAVLQELNQCARAHWKNIYTTGQLLKQIRDEELWRERVDQHGQSVYRGYLGFVAKEVGIKQAYATRLIRVVERFSEAEVGQWGIQRLHVAARLPESKRTKFLESTAHLPATQLASTVDTGMNGWPRMKGKAVVARVPLGRVLARMSARPNRTARVGVPQDDAVSIEQGPWAMVQVSDDLWVRVAVRRAPDGSGALVAAVSFHQGIGESEEG